MRSNWITF